MLEQAGAILRIAVRSIWIGSVLALAACGSGRGEGANVVAAQNEAATDSRELAVEAEGLRLVYTTTGATRPLSFDMPKEQLLILLQSILGPAESGTNDQCGAGPLDYAKWADGLTLHFQDDRFLGWALDRRAAGNHETVSGIGIGSTRRQLEAAYQVQVEETTLGTEFHASGLEGILDGEGPDARIAAMWAGVSCVFR